MILFNKSYLKTDWYCVLSCSITLVLAFLDEFRLTTDRSEWSLVVRRGGTVRRLLLIIWLRVRAVRKTGIS